MSQALTTTISEDTKLRLALALAMPSKWDDQVATRLEDVATEIGVSTADLALLLNEPGFLKLVRGLTKAQANLTLHSKGIAKLVDIATTGNDREALTAIKLIGQLTGDLRAGTSVEVKISFEDLRKRSSTDDPLGDLFEIKARAVEAEFEEVDDV